MICFDEIGVSGILFIFENFKVGLMSFTIVAVLFSFNFSKVVYERDYSFTRKFTVWGSRV